MSNSDVSQDNKTETPASTTATDVVKKEISYSERFAASVMKEFNGNISQKLTLTDFHKRILQNYFLKLDMTLKESEKKRLLSNAKLVKPEEAKFKNNLEFAWKNINMTNLALECVPYVLIGLDPLQPNHINLIPYKGNDGKEYGIGFIVGYKGLELKARKYGLDVPDDIVVEVIHKNDVFVPIKKDFNNKFENYTLQAAPFDKGDIIGGFYYIMYYNNPEKNKLRTFSLAEIEKRKPAYAAAEFWGGEKDVWEWSDTERKKVKTGTKKIDGWLYEMCYKTLERAGWNSVTIDAEKIDENLQRMQKNERALLDERVKAEITQNANTVPMTFAEAETIQPVEENKNDESMATGQTYPNVNITNAETSEASNNELTEKEKAEILMDEQQQQRNLFDQQKENTDKSDKPKF